VSTCANHPIPVRRALSPDDLQRIHTAIRGATSTRQLLAAALGALYRALSGGAEPPGPIRADRYTIPASQWQAILKAITRRAEAWGTAAEVGLELAMSLMPGRYDDPAVPEPELLVGDYRPAERRLTLSRDAVDVIVACEAYLTRLGAFYGPTSEVYQTASRSWHARLSELLTMNAGTDTRVDHDGDLSLLVHAGNGLIYALISTPRPAVAPPRDATRSSTTTAHHGRHIVARRCATTSTLPPTRSTRRTPASGPSTHEWGLAYPAPPSRQRLNHCGQP
jgi:hypothetical protein